MAGKRKSSTRRATSHTSRQPSPPVDFKGNPPMICTLGEDLEESRRLQVALEALRQASQLQGDVQ